MTQNDIGKFDWITENDEMTRTLKITSNTNDMDDDNAVASVNDDDHVDDADDNCNGYDDYY